MGWGILDIFCEKRMHDPSQIPTQKHLTLPSTSSKTKITGSVTHITASAHKAVNRVACDCTVKT